MATTAANRSGIDTRSITLDEKIHPSSAWFVLALRLVMGGMMLVAGLGKLAIVPGGSAFDAAGFLGNVNAASPVAGVYAAMAANPGLIELINVVIPATQLMIGIALLVGAFVRLAALGGALQMTAFYLGGWEGAWLAAFDPTLIYLVVFLALGALGAGRILGLDAILERVTLGDQPLVERFPASKYLLG